MEVTTMSEALQLHAQVLKLGTQTSEAKQTLSKVFTFAALSPSGDLNHARLILKSHPPSSLTSYHYNTIIQAYSRTSDPSRALSLFLFMLLRPTPHVPPPDRFTFPSLLHCCARLSLTRHGKQLHALLTKMGFALDLYIQNSLIHMYSEFGELGLAREVFDGMPERDVVSWTSIINGLVDGDRPIEALGLFQTMLDCGVEVNAATLVSVLRACADAGALCLGRRVHGIVKERDRFGSDCKISTGLIDMYAKSGCLEGAREVFEGVVEKDVFVWTAMVSCLASHGQCKDAVELFVEMEGSGVRPDERTMTAVLSACRNGGLVREGYLFLNGMRMHYGVTPNVQHFGCMVDLLARSGHLKEAEDLVNGMPIKPDAVIWRTLIWACKVHGDAKRAEDLMKNLEVLEMNACDSGSYILASNVYASVGKWGTKAKVRELMNRKELMKPPGSSRIEVDGVVHEFVMGDYDHPEADKIYAKLDEMLRELRNEGYDPVVSEVLLEMDDEEKVTQLLHHSEKLALAYGLIRTSDEGSKIRIVKNLRSCEDCHQFMKLISKIYQTEIIVRDRIRFHHFQNGNCSCKDFW